MTIHDCTWNLFWETRHYLNRYEIIMLVCFSLSWLFSIRKMISSGQASGKSSLFLWLMIFGFASGVCYKLFVNLDVGVILYGVAAILAFLDLFFTRRLYAREVSEIRRGELIKRSRNSSGEHGRHGSHSGHGSGEHGRHRHRHSHGPHSEPTADSDVSPKEPKYGDDVTFD